jgi:hypothetical protein
MVSNEVHALLNCLDGVVASFFGAPVVGFVAEKVELFIFFKKNISSFFVGGLFLR